MLRASVGTNWLRTQKLSSVHISAILNSILFSHGVKILLHCIISNVCPLVEKFLIYAPLTQNLSTMIYALLTAIILNWKAESAILFAFRMYGTVEQGLNCLDNLNSETSRSDWTHLTSFYKSQIPPYGHMFTYGDVFTVGISISRPSNFLIAIVSYRTQLTSFMKKIDSNWTQLTSFYKPGFQIHPDLLNSDQWKN